MPSRRLESVGFCPTPVGFCPRGLFSYRDSDLGDFVLGAFVRIPSQSKVFLVSFKRSLDHKNSDESTIDERGQLVWP